MDELVLMAKKSTLMDMQIWVMEQLKEVNEQLLAMRDEDALDASGPGDVIPKGI